LAHRVERPVAVEMDERRHSRVAWEGAALVGADGAAPVRRQRKCGLWVKRPLAATRSESRATLWV
jgi:hypothetical protein